MLSPNLIMQGEALDILIAEVANHTPKDAVTAGIMRYFVRPMSVSLCFGFVIAGLAMLLPNGAFDGAGYIEIGGVALALLLAGREFYAKRQELAV